MRRRYGILEAGLGASTLGFVILAVCPGSILNASEAARIALTCPEANGHSHKYLADVCRHKRSKASTGAPPKARQRHSRGQRRVSRQKYLLQISLFGSPSLDFRHVLQEKTLDNL